MGINLVAGGSGYFGTLLVKMLCDKGLHVRVFDLNDADDRPVSVEFIQGDIRERRLVEAACKGVDVIYHAVAQVPLAKSKSLFWSVNVDGTKNLFDSALRNRVKKVIYLSSSAVFGIPRKNPVDETVLPNPMEEYGKAKYEAEKLAGEYIKKGLEITIIRPRTILGHGRLGIFSILFNWVRSGRNLPVLGGGNNRYQFIHAHDLAHACILAASKSGSAIYNVGAEKFGTMRELLEVLIRHANSPSKVVSLPFGLATTFMKVTSVLGLSPLGDYHTLMYGREMFFDLTKTKLELGWNPKYNNSEMICESYDWYCDNYEKLVQQESNTSVHKKLVKEGALVLLKWFLR